MSSTDETTVTSTGLVKQKKYDWKDSNLALFGSDTEKNVSILIHLHAEKLNSSCF